MRLSSSLRLTLGALAAPFLVGGVFFSMWIADSAAARPRAELNVLSNNFTGNYLAGLHARRARDLGAASDYLLAALAKAPETPGLLRQAFIVTLVEGRMEEAIPLARKYLEQEPDQTIARIAVIVDDLKRKEYKRASLLAEKLTNRGLGLYAKPLLSAWIKAGLGQADAGVTDLKSLADRVPSLAGIHSALIQHQTGDTEAAAKSLITVTEGRSSPSARVSHLLGNIYELDGKPELAEAVYRLYLKSNPNSRIFDGELERLKAGGKPAALVPTPQAGVAEGLFGIATSLNQDQVYETALALGHLALYLKPEFPVLRYTMGAILEREGRDERAIEMYESIASGSAYDWPGQLQTAGLLGDLKRAKEAESRLTALSGQRPDVADPYVVLGDLLRRMEKYKEAAAAYDKAVERSLPLDVSDTQLLYARGIVLERSKQWAKAEKDLKKALEFRPNDPLILNYLGYSWIDQGVNLDEARAMIEKAVEQQPHDGYIVDSLGWAYFRLGDYEGAVRELERAIELRPQDPVINDHLGDAYWKVGREREARFQWRRALNLDPEPGQVKLIEKKLKQGLDG